MPSLRSGTPDVSSAPTGNQPRHARPPRRIAISAFSPSSSAKNSRASVSRRVRSDSSTPWPTIEKNPISWQAASISAAARRSSPRPPTNGAISTTGTRTPPVYQRRRRCGSSTGDRRNEERRRCSSREGTKWNRPADASSSSAHRQSRLPPVSRQLSPAEPRTPCSPTTCRRCPTTTASTCRSSRASETRARDSFRSTWANARSKSRTVASLRRCTTRRADRKGFDMSSHREAPEISKDPVADSTDLYAFVSPDAPDTVTLLANYVPLQGPAGGPNFYEFGDDVLYSIHIDNDADARVDISFEFRFRTEIAVGGTFLYNVGPITSL